MKIAVVGMGQGGMVAAIKLAQAGHDVTIYDREQEGSVSYPWKDDIRLDIFEAVGIPCPPEATFCKKGKWVFVSPDWTGSLAVPPLPPMEEVSIHRRGLSAHLATLCQNAGCKMVFDATITSLLFHHDEVVGLQHEGQDCYYDLVIDSCGMRSPLRAQIPSICCIEHTDTDGTLYAYRAFYRAVEGATTREKDIECTMVIKPLDTQGISWCNLNDEGNVDVLIARMQPFDDEQLAHAIDDLRAHNAILSDTCIYAKRVDICLSSAMPIFVAPGYVALGDSAFMTMPLMGSGIESSMKAGKMLADALLGACDPSMEALWRFERSYMRAIGADFAFIDCLKRWALSDKLTPSVINWAFTSGIVTSADLAVVSTESNGKAGLSLREICKRLRYLKGHWRLVGELLTTLLKALRAKRAAKRIPHRYSPRAISRYASKYKKTVWMA